ncbi:unnamed protein product [Thelazia callipaeda]|uniref:Uncharacterized protein n=1 Tax=Thelazia callipaeda TaxID=103827 RepID=A0A0N5CSF6_THECL|nr:unnamed protein product [Thelazia callipaeda]
MSHYFSDSSIRQHRKSLNATAKEKKNGTTLGRRLSTAKPYCRPFGKKIKPSTKAITKPNTKPIIKAQVRDFSVEPLTAEADYSSDASNREVGQFSNETKAVMWRWLVDLSQVSQCTDSSTSCCEKLISFLEQKILFSMFE